MGENIQLRRNFYSAYFGQGFFLLDESGGNISKELIGESFFAADVEDPLVQCFQHFLILVVFGGLRGFGGFWGF